MRRDEAVTSALEEWFERHDGDVEAFLAAHGELAPALRAHLDALDLLDQTFERPIAVPQAPSQIGPYRIVGEIGRGGMGTVYRAEGEDGGTVAVKVLHRHLLARPGFFKRFLREADLGRAVTHDNVVRTLDADALLVDGEEHHFLVMEYVEGRTLRELLTEVEKVPENLVRHIGHEVAQGLAAIHAAGAMHRDLKPENVLITDDHVVKVMDLGVARLQDDIARLSATGAFVGSIHYAAPEQFGGGDGGEADTRADLHALGVLLYELATGEHPFPGDDYRTVIRRILDDTPRRLGEVNPQVSPFLEELVRRLLAKDRDERFGSADELIGILDDGEGSDWWRQIARALRVETKRPLRRVRIPRETAVYGRDAEIERLRDLFARAQEGDGNVVLIEGEAGIGKSRLVDEFVARLIAEGEDIAFVHASYPPGGAATAMGAFSAAYRKFFGEEGLEDALAAHLTVTPLLVPAFGALLRGDAAPQDAEPLTKDSLQTCFVHLTRSLAKETTTIVLIDDLHFAPVEGRGLFSALALGVRGHRVLLVGTMRPGVPADWTSSVTRLEQTTHFELDRLGAKDVARLLIDAFCSERLAEELGFKIVMKSDGNPFFVFEIIRALRDGQLIRQQPEGTWVTTQIIQDIQVPSSVTDLVMARLSDLSDDERNLLDVASCWGFEFDALLIAEVLGLDRIPALRLLARIEARHRLVRAVGPRFAFDHHQVQETLYGALPELLRQEYHGAIATAFESLSGVPQTAIRGEAAVELCRHHMLARNPSSADRFSAAALSHLENAQLWEEAIALARTLLDESGLYEHTRRAKLLLRLGANLDYVGRYSEQRRAHEECLEIARTARDDELIYLGGLRLGTSLWRLADHAPAERVLIDTLGPARRSDDPMREANVRGALGLVLQRQNRPDEALAEFRHQAAVARSAGETWALAAAISHVGSVYQDTGRLHEALSAYREQHELATALGDARMESRAVGNLGGVQRSIGRLDEARALFERQLAMAEKLGDRPQKASALGNLGNVIAESGRPDDALALIERQLAMHEESGDREGEVIALGNLGVANSQLGRTDRARGLYLRCIERSREIGDEFGEALAWGNLGTDSTSDGKLGDARDCAERHAAGARATGQRDSEALARANLSTILSYLGEMESARQQARAALKLAHESGSGTWEAAARGRLARALAWSGAIRDAVDVGSRAAAQYAELGQRNAEIDMIAWVAGCHLLAGDEESARSLIASLLPQLNTVAGDQDRLLPLCYAARLGLSPPAAAEELLQGLGDSVEHFTRIVARRLLWKATGSLRHLRAAKQLLDHTLEFMPQANRSKALQCVPPFREIAADWSTRDRAPSSRRDPGEDVEQAPIVV